jgi:hypothetical protein
MNLIRLVFLCALLVSAGCGSCSGNNQNGGPTDSGTEEDTGKPPADTGVDISTAPDLTTDAGETGDAASDAESDSAASPGFTLTPTEPSFRVRVGGSAAIELDVERTGGFSSDIVVTVEGLPPGVGADPVTIEAGMNQAAVNVDALVTAAHAGPIPLTVRGVAADDSSIASEVTLDAYVAGAAGELDTSFGLDGELTYPVTDEYDSTRDAAVDALGRLVVVGRAAGNGFAVRLQYDGSADDTFGTDGEALAFGTDSAAYSLVLEGSEMVVRAESDAAGIFLRKLAEDGTVTGDFGTGGDVLAPDAVRGLVKWGDRYMSIDSESNTIVAYSADGADATFTPPAPMPLVPRGLAADGNRLLSAGYAGNAVAFGRLLEDGSLDESFGSDGVTAFALGDTPTGVVGPVMDTGGNAFALAEERNVASSVRRQLLLAVDTDGDPRGDLFSNGVFEISPSGLIGDLVVQNDGGVVIAYVEETTFLHIPKITRIGPDGTVDSDFGTDGAVELDNLTIDLVYDAMGHRLYVVSPGEDFRVLRFWL